MIISFGDRFTEDIYHGNETARVRRLPEDVLKRAQRKLDMIDAANKLLDLRVPPSNRLEKLKGDLAGYYSIRVNEQWRVIFRWSDESAHDLKITDYHD